MLNFNFCQRAIILQKKIGLDQIKKYRNYKLVLNGIRCFKNGGLLWVLDLERVSK